LNNRKYFNRSKLLFQEIFFFLVFEMKMFLRCNFPIIIQKKNARTMQQLKISTISQWKEKFTMNDYFVSMGIVRWFGHISNFIAIYKNCKISFFTQKSNFQQKLFCDLIFVQTPLLRFAVCHFSCTAFLNNYQRLLQHP
jgi:hypothetical protein